MKEFLGRGPLLRFRAVDLHIHTPASRDYKYEGPNVDQEYLDILSRASEQNLDVIAIGDHNTFEGYSRLRKLKEESEIKLQTLEQHSPESSAIPAIRFLLTLFSQILILPSVELEVKPGIHLILLFDPTTDVGDLHSFLKRAGVRAEDEREDGFPPDMRWDVLDAMREASELGGIAIAAHADSNKGIYNNLAGDYRASVFASDHLYAISFNSPVTKDKIRQLLQQKEYKRTTGLSLIQTSDYHGGSDVIGSKRTYLMLPRLDFSMVKRALRNPDERVSWPELPEIMQILDKLVSASDNVLIENLDTEGAKQRLAQAACAFSNTADGTIVVGVTEHRNLVGVSGGDEAVTQLQQLVEDTVSPRPRFEITRYPYGDREIVALRVMRGSASLYSYLFDGHFYLRVDNETRPGSALEISEIVETHLMNRASGLLYTSRQRLDDMRVRLETHVDGLEGLTLARKIERNSLPLSEILSYETSSYMVPKEEISRAPESFSVRLNGVARGNLISVTPFTAPREEERYLRFTAPKTNVDPNLLKEADISAFAGEKLILVPGGGFFYDTEDMIHVFCRGSFPAIVYALRSRYEGDLSYKFLAGWLKSAIPLWFAAAHFGITDLYDRATVLRLPVPVMVETGFQSKIHGIVDEIIELELGYIAEEESALSHLDERKAQGIDLDSEEYRALQERIILRTVQHNDSAAELMRKLEQEFYEFYGLTETDREVIRKTLKQYSLVSFA
ncbi:hypothetical protein ES703_19224 [subsurface metagenome]